MTSPWRICFEHNLPPKKQLGQNFLATPAIVQKIIAGLKLTGQDTVVEIGAGLGALTIPMAKAVERVYAVETDRALIPILKQELQQKGLENVTLIEKSILKMDITSICNYPGVIRVVGNLPYNISSQVLVQLFHAHSHIDTAAVMLQKELAERILAGPGTKQYGRLSVLLQYCADIKRLITVKAAHFYPKPKVDSIVLLFAFKREIRPAVTDEKRFIGLVKAAFSKRRKTLKNALVGSELHLTETVVRDLLSSTGIDPVRRAETLSVEEFVQLTNCLADIVEE